MRSEGTSEVAPASSRCIKTDHGHDGRATMKTKAARLRELIAKGCVAMPGVPNASMARQVERAGFDAVYISGAGMANATAGVPDIGLLTMTEVVKLAGYVAKAV